MDTAETVATLFEGKPTPVKPIGWLLSLENEIDEMAITLRTLTHMPPDEAMAWLSASSARVHEMILTTLGSESRLATKFRIEALISTRDELHWQFDVMSRRVTLMKIEVDQLRGMVG